MIMVAVRVRVRTGVGARARVRAGVTMIELGVRCGVRIGVRVRVSDRVMVGVRDVVRVRAYNLENVWQWNRCVGLGIEIVGSCSSTV